jgi:hypothetical protein
MSFEFPWEKKRRIEDETKVRRSKSMDIAKELYSLGIDDPQAINQATEHFIRTGEMKLPTTYQTRTQTSPGSVRQEGRTTISELPDTEVEVKPVRLGKKVGIWDEMRGEGREIPELQGVSELLKSPAGGTKLQGYTIFVDAATGKEVRREKNSNGRDEYVKVGSGAGGGGTKESPQEKAARDTLKAYDAALRSGKAPSADLESRASQAAKFLKLPTEKIVGKRGFWASVMGKEAPSYERPAFVGGEGGEAPTKNEFETEEEALKSGLPEGSIVVIGGKRFKLAR